MAEIRCLSTHCEFGTYLNDALRDRLVCGLRSESMQRRLLTEKELPLAKAMELAVGMKAAGRNAKSLNQGSEVAVHKLQTRRNVSKSQGTTRSLTQSAAPCYRCGRSNHHQNDCKFNEAECHFCHKKGHAHRPSLQNEKCYQARSFTTVDTPNKLRGQ